MGNHRIDHGPVESAPDRPRRAFGIGDAAGLEHVAGDLVEIAPGEATLRATHHHDEPER